jgi:alpha-L-fucosidase
MTEPQASPTHQPAAVAAQHAALGLDGTRRSPSRHTTHSEAQWFGSAGLGLFVHWGIACVHGDLDLSWSMIARTPWDASAGGKNKVTPEEYWKLAERFQPARYDPDAWLSAAKRAGFTYAVLTAMHHDGYTLWPTAHGELGVQSHLSGRDLVRPFVDACRRQGLKVGLYMSPPDWFADRAYRDFGYTGSNLSNADTTADRVGLNSRHERVSLPARPVALVQQMREQLHERVRELLTNYGKIDLLWFDGGTHDNELRDLARGIQPHLVINSRACDGDYDCTECTLPTERPTGWFETCHCWQDSDIISPSGGKVDVWGYLRAEQYKSAAWMLSNLVKLRAWGANLLLNIGPGPSGELPSVVYERFAAVAKWMEHSGQSLRDVEPGPVDSGVSVPVTMRSDCWYLHLLPGIPGEVVNETIHLRTDRVPRDATLLRTGAVLTIEQVDAAVVIRVPMALRTDLVDVVKVTWG